MTLSSAAIPDEQDHVLVRRKTTNSSSAPSSHQYDLQRSSEYARQHCIHQLFEAQVERTPEAIAVVYEGKTLTYAELNRRANQLAHYLRKLGIGPEAPVGLCLERSPAMIIALLGILKAGGGYVPFEPSSPKDRLAFMLDDTRAPVVLTQQPLTQQLSGHGAVRVVALDTDRQAISSESQKNPDNRTMPDSMAYIIYTSGSTGTPKGVIIQHASVINLWMGLYNAVYARYSDDTLRVSMNGSLVFDTSVKQWIQLLAGHTLYILPTDIRFDKNALQGYIHRHKLDVFECTPSQLKLLIEAESLNNSGHKPRIVLIGGEAIDEPTWNTLSQISETKFYNVYGPTECTVDATISEIRTSNAIPTIGYPLTNTQVDILERDLHPVSPGSSGELYISGAGVARGYLNHPALTAEKFLPHPFSQEPGARLYRSGDLTRHLPDGNIEFLGRIDDQVKIHGFRIEPGEIEATLRHDPTVQDAVVLATEDTSGKRRLVAYINLKQGQNIPSDKDLRRSLQKRLPYYMIPSVFVMLDAFPLTPNGKIDRRAFPTPASVRAQSGNAPVEPRDPLERLLVEIWQEILDEPAIGIHDNFFELGGDSIKGAIFVNRLQEHFHEIVHVVILFDAPTIAELSSYFAKHYPESVQKILGLDVRPETHAIEKRIESAEVTLFRKLLSKSSYSGQAESAAVKNPPMIFILSPPRSGSTLLRVMLGGHPELFAPPELALLPFFTLADRKTALSEDYSFRLEGTIRAVMQMKNCPVEEAQRIIETYEKQNLPTQQFYLLMQQWIQTKILVEKSTTYALDPKTLKRAENYFENPLYIHLSRHPYGMIRSFKKARLEQISFRYEHPFSRRELAELFWYASHHNILEFLEQIPEHRQHHVTFEDLTKRPQRTIEGICQFSKLTFHPEMLQPYQEKRERMTDGLHAVSRMIGDLKFHEHTGIEKEIADNWRKEYVTDFLGDMTWELAGALGYERFQKPSEEDPIGSIKRLERTDRKQMLKQVEHMSDDEVTRLLDEAFAAKEVDTQ